MPARAGLPGLEQLPPGAARDALRFLWDRIEILNRQTLTVATGALFPDARPKLTNQDVGALFYATDYNRIYRWTGTVWEDAQGEVSRNVVMFCLPGVQPNPSTGWALCNGQVVNRSTSDGTIEPVTLPTIPAYYGLAAWVRL